MGIRLLVGPVFVSSTWICHYYVFGNFSYLILVQYDTNQNFGAVAGDLSANLISNFCSSFEFVLYSGL